MTTVAIPTRAEEFEEFLGDPGKVKAMMSEPGKFQEFIKVYAKAVVDDDAQLKQQIKEQVQIGLADFMTSNGLGGQRLNMSNAKGLGDYRKAMGIDTSRVSHGKGAAYNRLSYGAQLEDKMGDTRFENSAEFFQSIWPRAATLRNAGERAKKRAGLLEIQD